MATPKMTRSQLADKLRVCPHSLRWFDIDPSNFKSSEMKRNVASQNKSSCLKGLVMDAITGRPIHNATICLKNMDHTITEVRSNKAGEYEISTLEAGRFRIVIRRQQYQPVYITAVLRSGSNTYFDILLNSREVLSD